MNKVLLLLIFSCLISAAQAQSFAINTDGSAAHNSALLDVKSTGKGMLVPRMSKAQRDAIAAPANGLMVYVNAPDTTGFSFYDGTTWKWMEEKGSGWGLSGNAGINPSVHFIGSTNPADLAFRIWNIERMRLTNEAELGISEPDPKYTLDIKTGFAAINNCVNNGLRIRSSLTANDCENGLLLGFPVNAQNWNNALIWNYGQNGSNPKNILFGLGQYEVMRITDNRELGIDEPAPKYNLDLYAGGTASFQCTDRLGMRINTPYTGSRDCNRGFFLGFNRDGSAVSEKISLWNFTSNATTNGQYFRFGFGQDFTDDVFSFGESMRILPPGQGVGIGVKSPLALLHLSNHTFSSLKAGMMVTGSSLSPNQNGFYMGLGDPFFFTGSEAMIWNYQDASIKFGTNNLERLTIKGNGNLYFGQEFITNSQPHVYFNVDTVHMYKDLLVGNKINATNLSVSGFIHIPTNAGAGKYLVSDGGGFGHWADFPSSPNYWVQTGSDLFNNNSGNTGIGVTDPVFKLDVGGRMRIRSSGGGFTAGLWLNNDANNASPAFMGMRLDNEVGFYGQTGAEGWRFYINTTTGNAWLQGTLTQASDMRLKKNIQPLNNALSRINHINGYTYNWTNNNSPDEQIGFLAQEIQKVYPQLVTEANNGTLSVNYSGMIPVLLQAIKEQQGQIDELKKRVQHCETNK